MQSTEPVKIEYPFNGDGNNIYYINGGRCSGKVNRTLNELVEYANYLQKENQALKDKLSKIETLIINHNCDTGDIYYKYNNRFLKSELKQRILEIVYEDESDDNE